MGGCGITGVDGWVWCHYAWMSQVCDSSAQACQEVLGGTGVPVELRGQSNMRRVVCINHCCGLGACRKEFYIQTGQRHYYFMNVGNGEVIDACRKVRLQQRQRQRLWFTATYCCR